MDNVEKVMRVGRGMLMFTLLLALTSCSGEVSANKTVAEPSKESVEILKEFASLAASLKYIEAKELLEDKYEIIQDNEMVLNNYGFMEFHIFRDYKKAEELFRRAVKLNTKNSEHYRGLGCVYEAQGQYNKAVECYQIAVKNITGYEDVPINPKLADLYTNIAGCYLKLGDREKAMEVLESASENNPFGIGTNEVLHKLYVETEQYGKAYNVWKNDNLIDGSKDQVYNRLPEWNRLYKDAVEGKKDMTHLQMARLYADLLLYDEAATEYKKALTQDQTNEEIKSKLHELEIYLSFRDELRSLLEDYYRERCINGMSEERNYYHRMKPAYEKISVLFPQQQYNPGSSFGVYMLNTEEGDDQIILWGPEADIKMALDKVF